jgi:membrane AbrB-like protein
VGLFGASILGPLILTAVFSLAGFLHHRPPAESIYLAQFFIGLAVGVKYVGVTGAEVRRAVVAAIGYTAGLFILSIIFTSFVVWMDFAPLIPALLAFSPGGQAEMAVLALVAGADVAFIITHHLARIILVIIGAPLVRRLF